MKPSQQIPNNPHRLIDSRIQVAPERPDPIEPGSLTLKQIESYKWDEEFVSLMKNRMLQGAFRYGFNTVGCDEDYVKHALHKLGEYQRTGNIEYLVDVANMIRLEFKFSRHPNKHFYSGDTPTHRKFVV